MEKQIIDLIKNNIIELSEERLESLYSYWRDENPEKHSTEWIQHKNLISKEQKVPPNAFLHGVDLPYWFGDQNSPSKIMIMGIDPMRNENVFESNNADKEENVLIGTPYAVHSQKMRAGKTKDYWSLINELSKNNFVYLTDIYKTFFYTDRSKKTRSYVYYRNSEVKHIARQIIAKEIEIVKPDVIITLGAETFQKFTDLKLKNKITGSIKENIVFLPEFAEVPVIPMVHLSGATFRNVKNTFLDNNLQNFTAEKTQSFGLRYAEIIDEFLHSRPNPS